MYMIIIDSEKKNYIPT